jgi:hypothetical protein
LASEGTSREGGPGHHNRRSFAARSGPDPDRPRPAAVRHSPVLARITGGKLFCGSAWRHNRCKKRGMSKDYPRSATGVRRLRTGEKKGRNSGVKSDNRGGTGWIRQGRNMPHFPHLSELTSRRIRCEFGNFFVGREGIRRVRHRPSTSLHKLAFARVQHHAIPSFPRKAGSRGPHEILGFPLPRVSGNPKRISFRGAGDPPDGPQGPVARGREPGNHDHRPSNTLMFIGSWTGPAGRPGTAAWYLNQFPDTHQACSWLEHGAGVPGGRGGGLALPPAPRAHPGVRLSRTGFRSRVIPLRRSGLVDPCSGVAGPCRQQRPAAPVLCRGRHRLGLPPTRRLPSNPLRRRSLSLVRGLPRCYAPVRLLRPLHRRLRFLAFPTRAGRAGRTGGLLKPVRRRPGFRPNLFLRDAVFHSGTTSAPRITMPRMLPSTRDYTWR